MVTKQKNLGKSEAREILNSIKENRDKSVFDISDFIKDYEEKIESGNFTFQRFIIDIRRYGAEICISDKVFDKYAEVLEVK